MDQTALQPHRIYYVSTSHHPQLEILQEANTAEEGGETTRTHIQHVPFEKAGTGRKSGEALWAAEIPPSPEFRPLNFFIDLGDGHRDPADPGRTYRTRLHSFWLQDGQIFSYHPAHKVSPSEVHKIPYFQGSLPTRPLYVYLPRGYQEHTDRFYPVLYMQDGQNVFEAYAADSYVGSWHADETANRLIEAGTMEECVIVGVSHGGEARLAEYLPPYATMRLRSRKYDVSGAAADRKRRLPFFNRQKVTIYGRADRTADYYQDQVMPFILANYRVLSNRTATAVCGSSMGGLFSLYLGWEYPGFARHIAALSPAFSATKGKKNDITMLNRIDQLPLPDVRLWLDSGTLNTLTQGDDDFPETRKARDLLVAKGMKEGSDFQYFLDQGALHNESAWAARLPLVFEFLFPAAPLPAEPESE